MLANNRQSRKKAAERRVVDGVRRLWPNFPAGEIKPDDPPDFLVSGGDGPIVGIEVETYYRPKNELEHHPKEQDSLRKRVAVRVREQLERGGHHSYNVALFFNGWHQLSKKVVMDLADAIIKIVLGLHLQDEEFVRLDGSRVDLPQELSAIRITRLRELPEVFCGVPSAVYVPSLGLTDIQNLIQKKEKKLGKYLAKCGEMILIIEIDGFQSASIAEIADGVLEHEFASGFSHILLFINRNRVEELKVRQRTRNV